VCSVLLSLESRVPSQESPCTEPKNKEMEDNSEAHIKLDLKESIIKEALSSGVDLRVFSLEVERELQEVSNNV